MAVDIFIVLSERPVSLIYEKGGGKPDIWMVILGVQSE